MGKLKQGLFLGSLVGAGISWLTFSKKGQEVRQNMMDYSADIYEDVRGRILDSEAWDKLSKNQYMVMVRETVDKYGAEKGLSGQMKDKLTKVLGGRWRGLEKDVKKTRRGKR